MGPQGKSVGKAWRISVRLVNNLFFRGSDHFLGAMAGSRFCASWQDKKDKKDKKKKEKPHPDFEVKGLKGVWGPIR